MTAIARREGGRFVYDLILEPCADLDALRFVCEGQDALFVDAEGALVMRTRWGDLRHSAPVAWDETAAGVREPVACEWRALGRGRCGFAAPGHDPSRRLVIDPGIIWSTILGGTGQDNPGQSAMVSSANFDLNITGFTESPTYPTTPGAYQTTIQGLWTYDAFVSRFSASGTLRSGPASSVGTAGTGRATSRSVRTTPSRSWARRAPRASPSCLVLVATRRNRRRAFGDGFLATFNPSATGVAQLTWSTYLGGTNDDRLNAVSVDAANRDDRGVGAILHSCMGPCPPTRSKAPSMASRTGILARLNPSLSGLAQLQWYTYVGGSSFDLFNRMVVTPSGFVVVQGSSQSTNYPVVTPFQPNLAGALDIVVSVFDPFLSGLSQLVYSTYLGEPASSSIAASQSIRSGASPSPVGRCRPTTRRRPAHSTRATMAVTTSSSAGWTRCSHRRASSCSRRSSAGPLTRA